MAQDCLWFGQDCRGPGAELLYVWALLFWEVLHWNKLTLLPLDVGELPERLCCPQEQGIHK